MIYYVVTEREMEVALPAILETTQVMHKRMHFLMAFKFFSLKSICQKPNQ